MAAFEPVDLGPVEVRVVGCLVEKAATTPDTYPLTLNALVAACNQSTGRAPVLSLAGSEVEAALRSLKERGWVRFVHPSHGSRSEKYRHVADEVLQVAPAELAVLALLALRGPQTPGELKGRSERLHAFDHVDEVQRALEALDGRGLAVRLPRRLGQKELRWAHLLSGDVVEVDDAVAGAPLAPPPKADRLADLEQRVVALEAEVAALRAALGA